MATNIPISGLEYLTEVRLVDYVPIVLSGSTVTQTTYRTPISVINDFFARSGSVLSASHASHSISSSWSWMADSASYLYPTILYAATTTASVSASHAMDAMSSSYSTMSFWAVTSSNAISSSYALRSTFNSHSINAETASFLYSTYVYRATVTASVTASWARLALTASNANTASWGITSSYALAAPAQFLPGMIMAYGKSSAPTDWLKCDNSVFSAVTYPNLASAIGTSYGPAISANIYVSAPTPNPPYGYLSDAYINTTILTGEGDYASRIDGGAWTFSRRNNVLFAYTGLAIGAHTIQYIDLTRNPNLTMTFPFSVTALTTYTYNGWVLNAAEYRTPALTNFVLTPPPYNVPFIWIIKT